MAFGASPLAKRGGSPIGLRTPDRIGPVGRDPSLRRDPPTSPVDLGAASRCMRQRQRRAHSDQDVMVGVVGNEWYGLTVDLSTVEGRSRGRPRDSRCCPGPI